MRTFLAAVLSSVALFAGSAHADPAALVICAPGFPGNSAEAQPTIDALVAAMATAAKWAPADLTGVYYETEKGGVARLSQADVGLALVPLALFLEQQEALKLQPRLAAIMKGRTESTEVWSLVAKKGSVTGTASLDGWKLSSSVGFSPRFVKGPALGAWGKLPDTVTFVQTGQVLSAMRKAAQGDKVALLLDGEQTAALATSPFAKDLEIVTRSAPLPAAILATVGVKIPDARLQPLLGVLPKLGDTPDGAKALEGVWKLRFTALDEKALATATKAFKEVK